MFVRYVISLFILSFSLFTFAGESHILGKGEAKTISMDKPVSTVFISDPKVADYKVINSKTIVLYAVDLGTTSILIYDSQGKEIYSNNIVVNFNLSVIRDVIDKQFPDEKIVITNIADNVVLSGVVSSEEVKTNVYHVVGTLLEKEQESVRRAVEADGEDDPLRYTTKYDYSGIVNNLSVITANQINVKVTIAEVSSSFLTSLGINYATNGNPSGTFINRLLDFSAEDIIGVISALGNENIGQILAEPNLTVFSGEQANFLVGGELPIAVREDDGITIHYKEYGIKLSMVAKVIDDDNIRLTLEPEVSSFDEGHQTTTGLVNIPAFNTRKAMTTVQLKNGQSFVLAGLLSSQDSESLSKIPYLGDIPILGAFFNHSQSVRSRTELIIVATVNLVDPVSQDSIALPIFRPISDIERLLQIDFSTEANDSPELADILNQGGFN